MTKQETIIRTAGELLGCPYVYGAWGSSCTVALRRKYARLRPAQAKKTYARCQRLRPSKPVSSCEGCKYQGLLAFDCRGFVHYVLKAAGIEITGQAVGTQWSGKNWAEKGEIAAMPDLIAAVFIKKSGKWEHVGLHLGGGRIIHCSGEVKEETLGSGRSWTHYAIPAGLYTPEEIRKAHEEKGTFMRIMRKGCEGEDVRALQEMLIKLGYSCGGKGADGIYGTNTEAAVKAFQAVNGIKADGVAGPQTMALLAAQAQAAPAGESRNEETEQEKPDPGAAQEEPAVPEAEDPDSVRIPRQELEQALRALGDIAETLEKWMGNR